MIPAALNAELTSVLGTIRQVVPVGGGDISTSARVESDRGTYFVKFSADDAGTTFEAEANGLRALAEAAANTGLHVPAVLHARNRGGAAPGVLVIEWVEAGREDETYWRSFGRGLARMHGAAAPRNGAERPYGFDADNFIGRLPQSNRWHADWPSFFREERLGPQFERARRSRHWDRSWNAWAERVLDRLDELLPASPHPSMLHGDLWSGNARAGAEHTPWIFDPAAYVGDREADLAMTELFGGFSRSFYDAYRSEWPLDPGYEARRELYNLYHLVNHLNHFGGSYAGSVSRVLRAFGA